MIGEQNTAAQHLVASPYAYYKIFPDSVTHLTLNQEESRARTSIDHLRRITSVAQSCKMQLAVGTVDDTKLFILIANKESTPSPAMAPIYDMDKIQAGSRLAAKAAQFYIIEPIRLTPLVRSWKNIHDLIKTPTAPLEEILTAQARKEHIKVPSLSSAALVSLGNSNIRASAHKVVADWYYQSPIDPKNNNRFIPPEAREVSLKDVMDASLDVPLREFNTNRRVLGELLSKLPRVDLAL